MASAHGCAASCEPEALSAVSVDVLTSCELVPATSGFSPLLAVLSPNLIAVTTCGCLVNLFRGGERLRTWQLPSRVVVLQWVAAPPAPCSSPVVTAITLEGHTWRLGFEDDAAERSAPKRARAAPSVEVDDEVEWSAPRRASEAQRVHTTPVRTFAQLFSAVGEALLRADQLPAHLLPPVPCAPELSGHGFAARAGDVRGAGRPRCILCVRNASIAAASAASPGGVPLSADLLHALVGRHGASVLHVDGSSTLCATSLPGQQPAPAGHETVRLLALGRPPVQMLGCDPEVPRAPHSSGGGRPGYGGLLVLLGPELLLLTADKGGALRRQLWRLPAVAHAACWLSARELLLLCTQGTWVVQLPARHTVCTAAEAAAAGAGGMAGAAAGACSDWTLPAAWWAGVRRRAAPDAPSPPPLVARPVALAGVCVAAVRVSSLLGEKDGASASSRREVVLLLGSGRLAHVRLSEAVPDPADSAGAARFAVASAFCAPLIEHGLRETLRSIGEAGARMRVIEAEGEQEQVAVRAAGGALGAVGALRSDVRLTADLRTVLTLRNDGAAAIGHGWSVVALLVQKEGLPSEHASGLRAASHCTPVAGLPAAGTWQLELPLQLEETSRPAALLVLGVFSTANLCAGGQARPTGQPPAAADQQAPWHPPSACVPIGYHPLHALHLLRPAKSQPAVVPAGSLAAEARLHRIMQHSKPTGARLPAGWPPLLTQFRLRILAPREASSTLLSFLLRDSAFDVSAERVAGGGGGSVVAEMPWGAEVTLRLTLNAAADANAHLQRTQLTVQSHWPEALWSVRAALLQVLCGSEGHADALAPTPRLPLEKPQPATEPETSSTQASVAMSHPLRQARICPRPHAGITPFNPPLPSVLLLSSTRQPQLFAASKTTYYGSRCAYVSM